MTSLRIRCSLKYRIRYQEAVIKFSWPQLLSSSCSKCITFKFVMPKVVPLLLLVVTFTAGSAWHNFFTSTRMTNCSLITHSSILNDTVFPSPHNPSFKQSVWSKRSRCMLEGRGIDLSTRGTRWTLSNISKVRVLPGEGCEWSVSIHDCKRQGWRLILLTFGWVLYVADRMVKKEKSFFYGYEYVCGFLQQSMTQ